MRLIDGNAPKKEIAVGKEHVEPLDTAKKIIKEYYKDYDCGIFDTPNGVGDPMGIIYMDDSIEILGCYYYSYFEVFGLSKDDFDKLKDYYNRLEQEARM